MPYIKKDTDTPSFEYMFVLSKGKPKTFNLTSREKETYAGKILKTNTTNPERYMSKENYTTKDTKE
jgi:hypothetical protein